MAACVQPNDLVMLILLSHAPTVPIIVVHVSTSPRQRHNGITLASSRAEWRVGLIRERFELSPIEDCQSQPN